MTKLSLLLKVLEGESSETLTKQLDLFKERALPDLDNNIQCGNSLIAADYYDSIQLNLMSEEEIYRVNVFNWEEGFPNIMKQGGFDIVIGNPPWGASFKASELSYIKKKHKDIIVRMTDSFMFFVKHSCKKLVKSYWGMIVPDVILYQIDNYKLRSFLLDEFKIEVILNMGDVFEKVIRPTSIIICSKTISTEKKNNIIFIQDVSFRPKIQKSDFINDPNSLQSVSQSYINDLPYKLFITNNIDRYQILKKVYEKEHFLLKEVVDKDGIQRGVSPDLKEAFIVNSVTIESFQLESTKLRPVVTGGRQVKKYYTDQDDLWLIYTCRNDDFEKLPNICKYIDRFKDKITCKEVKQNKHSLYSLHRPREENIFLKSSKILGVITGDRIIATLDNNRIFATDGLYLFGVKEFISEKYILGLLNSRLFVFLYRLLALEEGRVLAQVKPTILNSLPIYKINENIQQDVHNYNEIIRLVDQLLFIYPQRNSEQTPPSRKMLKNQIDAMEKQIDQLVYQLYGITDPQEIAMIEGNEI
jgi:hypothetical protein